MIDPSWNKSEVSDFGGAWTLVDPTDVPQGRALTALNCEYNFGQISTRKGFAPVFGTTETATAMTPWLSGLGTRLVWFAPGTGVRHADITAGSITPATIVSTALGNAASFAPAGPRMYLTIYNTVGISATSARVISFQSAAYVADKLFSPPMTYTPGAPTEPGAGVVTAGTHRLGYIIEYRHGFIGRPNPDSGSGTPAPETFLPVSFVATGAKNLQWVLNTTWPTDAVKVHIIMTSASNNALYLFVPGANFAVTGGATSSHTVTINIADDDLLATGEDATKHQFFLAQTVGGVDPFDARLLVSYGDRMGYVTSVPDSVGNAISAIYVSERNNYQQVAADKALIQLPGQRTMTSAFALRDTLYILGEHWTYATRDTGTDPVEWPAPWLIDGRRGTLSARGVQVSPSGEYAWIADETGLYLFDGAYPALPISYYNTPEWNRINWNVRYMLQIVDDPAAKRVYVMAPLDSATSPSHILIWDYTRGLTPDKVSFSLDNLVSYSLGAMALVPNQTAAALTNNAFRMELWLGPFSAGKFLRRTTGFDANPYRDDAQPISFQYDLSLLPGKPPVRLMHHHGGFIRAFGSGTLAVSARHLDGSWSTTLSPITLATSPGQRYMRMFHRPGEQVSYRFSTSALDAHATVSAVEHYWLPYARQR